MKYRNKLWKVPIFMLFAALFVLFFGTVVMFLWNWLIPAIFAGPEITFWQALGILLLARILTGGMSWKKGWKGGHHHPHYRNKWREKWAQMSPEEKARWRDKYARWCNKWDDKAHYETEETDTETKKETE